MQSRAANVYRRIDLDSAPKHQILDRLYARFARDLDCAREAIARRDIPAKAAAIDHAMRIVAELAAALDHDLAPELCANLAALYDFVSDRLISASFSLEAAPLDQAGRIMAELGAAFREAQAQAQASAPAQPIAAAGGRP